MRGRLKVAALCLSTLIGFSAILPGCGISLTGVKQLGTLRALTVGTTPKIDMEKSYYAAIDKITQKKLGMKLRWTFVDAGEYPARAASGNYELMTVGPWGNFSGLAAKGQFYDFNGILSAVPSLTKKYGQTLRRSQSGGKLYLIPETEVPSPEGLLYRSDLAKSWGVGAVSSIASLQTYLTTAFAKFNAPQIYNANVTDAVGDMLNPTLDEGIVAENSFKELGIFTGDPWTVRIYTQSDAFRQAVLTANQWYNSGIVTPDAQYTTQVQSTMLADGKVSCDPATDLASARRDAQDDILALNGGAKADAAYGNPKGIAFDFWAYGEAAPQAVARSTGLAVSAHASRTQAAALLRYIEMLHTDKVFYDAVQYGVKGIGYTSFPSAQSVDYGSVPQTSWVAGPMGFGGQDASFLRSQSAHYADTDKSFAAVVSHLTEEKKQDPLEGFVFDSSAVQVQLTACAQVIDTYGMPLAAGDVSPKGVDADIAQLNSKLQAAGIDAVRKAEQSQLDAFKKAFGG